MSSIRERETQLGFSLLQETTEPKNGNLKPYNWLLLHTALALNPDIQSKFHNSSARVNGLFIGLSPHDSLAHMVLDRYGARTNITAYERDIDVFQAAQESLEQSAENNGFGPAYKVIYVNGDKNNGAEQETVGQQVCDFLTDYIKNRRTHTQPQLNLKNTDFRVAPLFQSHYDVAFAQGVLPPSVEESVSLIQRVNVALKRGGLAFFDGSAMEIDALSDTLNKKRIPNKVDRLQLMQGSAKPVEPFPLRRLLTVLK